MKKYLSSALLFIAFAFSCFHCTYASPSNKHSPINNINSIGKFSISAGPVYMKISDGIYDTMAYAVTETGPKPEDPNIQSYFNPYYYPIDYDFEGFHINLGYKFKNNSPYSTKLSFLALFPGAESGNLDAVRDNFQILHIPIFQELPFRSNSSGDKYVKITNGIFDFRKEKTFIDSTLVFEKAFDGEIGRLNPYIGLGFVYYHTKTSGKGSGKQTEPLERDFVLDYEVENSYYGAGPNAGFEMEFYITKYLSLISNLGGSLYFGPYNAKIKSYSTITSYIHGLDTTSYSANPPKFGKIVPSLRGNLALKFEHQAFKNGSFFITLGAKGMKYFNINDSSILDIEGSNSHDAQRGGNLSVHGAFLEIGIKI